MLLRNVDAKLDMGAEHIHMEDGAVGSYQLDKQLWSYVVPDLKILEGWEGKYCDLCLLF